VSSQSSSSRRVCRDVLFDKLDTAKMHGLDTSDVSRRGVTSQVEFGLYTARVRQCLVSEDVFLCMSFQLFFEIHRRVGHSENSVADVCACVYANSRVCVRACAAVHRGVGKAVFPDRAVFSGRLFHDSAVVRCHLPQPQLAW